MINYNKLNCGVLRKGPLWDKESGTWDLIFKERGEKGDVVVPFESRSELRKTMNKLNLEPIK